MSIRGRNGHVWVTLREMRIGRIDRKVRVKPCADEVSLQIVHLQGAVLFTVLVSLAIQFANYMKALQAVAEDGPQPREAGKLLTDCMDNLVSLQDISHCA